MMKRLLIIPLLLVLAFFVSSDSQATVLVNDADSNAVVSDPPGVTSDTVQTGSGQLGDFELIACGINPDLLGAVFSDPTPGSWDTIDTGTCGGGFCNHGIWGRFTEDTESVDITCSWDIDSQVFAAGSFRYSDVDPDNPVIAVSCNSGEFGGEEILAVAPSVITEAGSQVVRIYTYSNVMEPEVDTSSSNDEVSGSFRSIAAGEFENIIVEGTTQLFFVDGQTGEASIVVGSEEAFWRACTIALRMEPTAPIPTMSEWGFIAVTAFMGAAGVWFLRRKQAQGA